MKGKSWRWVSERGRKGNEREREDELYSVCPYKDGREESDERPEGEESVVEGSCNRNKGDADLVLGKREKETRRRMGRTKSLESFER